MHTVQGQQLKNVWGSIQILYGSPANERKVYHPLNILMHEFCLPEMNSFFAIVVIHLLSFTTYFHNVKGSFTKFMQII